MPHPQTFRAALTLMALIAASGASVAGDYPDKPVRIVVGFAAGGPTDVVARAFAEHATRSLGQTFLVENRPGANTVLAAEAVRSSPADGYTLLFGATNHTMIPAVYAGKVKFDAVRSFSPVCVVATSPTVLVVSSALPVRTLPEFLQALRAAPGQRTVGSAGSGSSGHFAAERFLRMTNTSMNHIPYKGSAPMTTELMGGMIDSSFATLGSVLPQLQSGKLKPIAIATDQRSAFLPSTPTFDEAGVKGYRDTAWYGLLAPAGTPGTILAVLEKTSRAFAESPASAEKLRTLGMNATATCGEPFAEQIRREVQTNTRLAKELDLQPD